MQAKKSVCVCARTWSRSVCKISVGVCVQCLRDLQLSALHVHVHVQLACCSPVSNILSHLPNPYPHPISSVPGLHLSPHPHPRPISPVPHPHPISPGASSSPMSLLPCPRPISPVPRPDPISPMTGLHPISPLPGPCPSPRSCSILSPLGSLRHTLHHLEAKDTGRSRCLRSQSTGDFRSLLF